jgi:uncharacterized SAM-binding protein YcdF (DUF218 family)
VRDLIWFFFSVGGVVALMLVGVVWLWKRPHAPHPRRFLAGVAMVYAFFTIYAIGYGEGRILTIGFHPLVASDVPPGRTAIVVLGSGGFTARDWTNGEYSIVDQVDATRAVEAARVFRLTSAEWIISSGGKPDPDDPNEASGMTIRAALVALGIPASQILIETESRNTRDEALIIAPMLRGLNVEHVVIVTSHDHMRRSMGAFRAAGVRAIPAIAVDPYAPDSWIDWIVPSQLGLWKTASVVHEVIGIAYYVVRGWYGFR